MTLRWKEFERRAKKLARAEIRASPKLNAERNKAPAARRASNQTFLFQFLVTMFAFAPLLTWIQVSVEVGFAALAISITGAAFLIAWGWHNRFYNGPDIAAFLILPLASDTVFRIQSRRAFRATWLVVASFALLYGARLAHDGTAGLANALILAVGQTLLAFAVVAHVLAYFPANLIPLTGLALTIGWCLVSVGFGMIKPMGAPVFWTPLTWFLPASWLHQLYFALSNNSSWTHMLFALPIAVVFALAPHSFNRFRGSYTFALDNPDPAAAKDLTDTDTSPAPPRTGPTELAERASAGLSLLTPEVETKGFIERFLIKRLTERERLLVLFIWRRPDWTRKWIWSATALTAIGAIAVALPRVDVSASTKLLWIAAFMFGHGCLPIFSAYAGFQGWPCGGNLFASQFAFVPIAFNEMFRITLKINSVRLLAAMPFWILFSACVGTVSGQATNALFSAKLLLALAVVQPLLFTTSIASTMTIKRKFWVIPFVVIFVLLVAAGLIYWLGIPDKALNFVQTPLISVVSLVAIALISLLLNHYFRWLYRGKQVDALAHKTQ